MSGKTAPVRRARHGIITVVVITMAAYVVIINQEAWRAGFYTRAQMNAASVLGLSNRHDLAEHQRRARERAEKAKQTAAENAAAAARTAEEACPKDVACWGQKHASAAAVACAPHIERLAKFQHEWTGPRGERMFSTAGWRDRLALQLSYVGDKIKFQNGFGAWQYHVYTCAYDTVTGRVVGVEAKPGRLAP